MRTPFRTLLAAILAVSMVAFAGCFKEYFNNDVNSGTGTEQPTPQPTPAPRPEPISHNGWVDLALPSGLLWATCNVGATAFWEYGDRFAWGETEPKDVYDWRTYRYCTVDGEGKLSTLTKYNTSTTFGTVDNLTTLEPDDDAATVHLGDGARTPTIEEWEELKNNTTSEWTTLNGVAGRSYTAANGNKIFLPVPEHSGTGIYWSASLYTGSPDKARYFVFYPSYPPGYSAFSFCERPMCFPVRAVRPR